MHNAQRTVGSLHTVHSVFCPQTLIRSAFVRPELGFLAPVWLQLGASDTLELLRAARHLRDSQLQNRSRLNKQRHLGPTQTAPLDSTTIQLRKPPKAPPKTKQSHFLAPHSSTKSTKSAEIRSIGGQFATSSRQLIEWKRPLTSQKAQPATHKAQPIDRLGPSVARPSPPLGRKQLQEGLQLKAKSPSFWPSWTRLASSLWKAAQKAAQVSSQRRTKRASVCG